MVENFCQGTVPVEDAKDRIKTPVLNELKRVAEQLEHLQFHSALSSIISAVEHLNGFIEEQAPWKLAKTAPAECQSVLREVLLSLKALAYFLWPFMPDTAQILWRQLGQTDDLTVSARRFFHETNVLELAPGQKTQKGTPLFPRK